MNLLGGAPVYEAMLERMLPDNIGDEGETTLIEIPVSKNFEQAGEGFKSSARYSDCYEYS